jgi:hypothetical protein
LGAIFNKILFVWGLRFLLIGSRFNKLENRKEEKPGASYRSIFLASNFEIAPLIIIKVRYQAKDNLYA